MKVPRIPVAHLFRRILSSLKVIETQERLAVWGTLTMLAFVPLSIWWYEAANRLGDYPEGAKVFDLTGIGTAGTWTLEDVSGYNYWWRSFPQATISVDQGDIVVLRLKSADVTHSFYAPTLGLSPITVEPGHVKEVTFRTERSGVHRYYCILVCGECHFFMRGEIVVREGGVAQDAPPITTPACIHTPSMPSDTSLYQRGRVLFESIGCVACHGKGGSGGILNPNYVKGTVPALNKMGRTLSLVDQEAAANFFRLVEQEVPLDGMADLNPDIPRLQLVLAKYGIVRDVIREGRAAARTDTTSYQPPLSMPAWKERLSRRDIDAIIVYLLKQQSWESSE